MLVKFWVGLDFRINGIRLRLSSVFKIMGRDYLRFWLSGSKLMKSVGVGDRDNMRLFVRIGMYIEIRK